MTDKLISLQYTTVSTPVPDFIYEGIREFSRNANTYRSQPKALISKLAPKFNLPEEMFFLTAGADEAINMFALAYGQSAHIFTPTYVVYSEVGEFHAKLTQHNALINDQYTISTDHIEGASLIYLANPNNPFGFTSREKIIELIKNNPDAVIVVDEVYAEFADLSVIQETKNYQNLAVLRSFSKSYGMAANRVAYVVAEPQIIKRIRSKTQWDNVSYLSVGAAITALDHEEYYQNLIKEISQRRVRFATLLNEKNYAILPSLINAVLIKFSSEEEGTAFVGKLKQNNIIVSHGNANSNVGLDKSFVRISIGTETEMAALEQAILV